MISWVVVSVLTNVLSSQKTFQKGLVCSRTYLTQCSRQRQQCSWQWCGFTNRHLTWSWREMKDDESKWLIWNTDSHNSPENRLNQRQFGVDPKSFQTLFLLPMSGGRTPRSGRMFTANVSGRLREAKGISDPKGYRPNSRPAGQEDQKVIWTFRFISKEQQECNSDIIMIRF